MERYSQVQQFLVEYGNFFSEIMHFESQKLSALLKNDMESIEKNILIQQANMMRMDAIERKRENVLARLGFEQATFSQLIECFDGNEKHELTKIYSQLTDTLSHIKYYNQKSMEMAKMVLSLYEAKIIEEFETNDMGQG